MRTEIEQAKDRLEREALANFAHHKVAGLQVSLPTVLRYARHRTERERHALVWLFNYTHNVARCTGEQLLNGFDHAIRISGGITIKLPARERLALTRDHLRACLTDPDADLGVFVRAVERYRAAFEAFIPALVKTRVDAIAGEAFDYAAAAGPAMVELLGKNRTGKSECLRLRWLRNLHRCVWVECPAANDYRSFAAELARPLGIGTDGSTRAGLLTQQLKACFGPHGIDVLIMDEAHRLWPPKIQAKPLRIELERELYADGRGCSILNVATYQFTESLNRALEQNARWAPGQYQGRVTPFHLPAQMPERDLRAVAAHYAGGAIEPEAVATLVDAARSTEGYCGLMVNVIKRARLRAGAGVITDALVVDIVSDFVRGTRLDQLAEAKAMGRNSKFQKPNSK
ncbi:MAG: ATP-binding protein [Verrucomicrobiales bacterium]|jgi:hypothetical protein|nr:ATP-binding protein [Verrucomicrobiales bacterium]